MPSQDKKRGLQDIIKRRQQTEFVGRQGQIALFKRNLSLSPNDERRRFIFEVYGQGGIGKSWLLRYFRKLAEEANFLTAYTDEFNKDVLQVMECVASQFQQQGYQLKTFSSRYRVYRQKRQEFEADPEAPQDIPDLLGRTLSKVGISAARHIPVGGVVVNFIDDEALSAQAGKLSSYLARKLTNKDEVRLLLEPIEVLTPIFLTDLHGLAEDHPLALFFDTYEITGELLDRWLRELLEGKHGILPENIVITIAGRDALNKNSWAPYRSLLASLSLEPFSEEEALDFLSRKGITNKKVIDTILRLSGQLPLLLATLAVDSPQDPDKVGDPSDTAIERFLKWEKDPGQRQVALDAAIPRYFNRDVLAVITGEEGNTGLFTWLKRMPFISEHSKGWHYHPVVRHPMLRYKRRESSKSWGELHKRLAEYYDQHCDDLKLVPERRPVNADWQDYKLQAIYHHLCFSPYDHLPIAINGFIGSLKSNQDFAGRWAETIWQAGEDAGAEELQSWGKQLIEGVKSGETYRLDRIVMFSALLGYSGLENQWKGFLLSQRGITYIHMSRYNDALIDLNRSLELNPDDASSLAHRGSAYHRLHRNKDALNDLNRSIEIDPKYIFAIATRGEVLKETNLLGEALKDLDHAVTLDPSNHYRFTRRAVVYNLMGRNEDAMSDLNRAIELEPNYSFSYYYRGAIYHDMGRTEDAVENLSLAIDRAPTDNFSLALRGHIYIKNLKYDKGLADLNHAIELDPNHFSALHWRGQYYYLCGRHDDALKDFTKANESKAQKYYVLVDRGKTYLRLERYDEALEDFTRAIELSPNNTGALSNQILAYIHKRQFNDALTSCDQVINKTPLSWYYYLRGVIYLVLNQRDKADAEFRSAIDLERKGKYKAINLALYHVALGQVEEAERLYNEVEIDLNTPTVLREAVNDLDDFFRILPMCVPRDRNLKSILTSKLMSYF